MMYVILLISILLIAPVMAQDWGPMQYIWWDEGPPISSPGIFNPSYCDDDSMLYFDGFLRYGYSYPDIWSAQFDGLICHNAMALPYPINLPGQPEIINAMPSISAGGDTLFFCSDRPGTYGGLDIWMSIKVDTIWGEQVNLGDSVNSELDELAPHYAPGIQTLFFDRLEEPINDHFGLYSSIYQGDGIWQTAQRLPEIINPIEYGSHDAYYNELDSTLYFNLGFFGEDIYISKNINGEWTEPLDLNDNVNGLWTPNINDWVSTRGACLSADGQLLFYSKGIWEYHCIDFTSALFFSEWTVDIDEVNEPLVPNDISMSIYPNPSNTTFHIQIEHLATPSNLKIYNMLGRLVNKFALNADDYMIEWNGTDTDGAHVSTGMYFAVVESDGLQLARKMVLLK
ncbi:MAG: T9SS type A sorting domain-containing protein [candidate division Zixibacteria bacterium]|nr:T9SS type A sorting domain-containing protein [candidate division Zixibacteria bacterium]